MLGTLLTGVFATEGGLLYGGGWRMLGIQGLGAVTVVCWAFACGFLLFFLLDRFFGIRVSPRIEEEGLDIYEHGETAYNN